MNREDIIKMAREAGFSVAWPETVPNFERFAALVAAEREACAQIAEDEWLNYSALNEAHQQLSPLPFNPNNFDIDMSIALMSKHIADLIRDRGDK
jgi:hypothetical protein